MANLIMLPVLLLGLISTVTPQTTGMGTPRTIDRALRCQTCTDFQCLNTTLVTCSSETMCITATSFGNPYVQIFKGCASSSLCPATGYQTFSVSLGIASEIASVKCCNTDNCNRETLPRPAFGRYNGRTCYVCSPVNYQCTSQVACSGVENRCFQGSTTRYSSPVPAGGCISANMCAALSKGFIPFMRGTRIISSGLSCCGGSSCNAPPTSTTEAPTLTTAAPTTTAITTTTAPPTSTTAPATTTAPPTTTTAPPTSTTAAPTTTAITTTTTTPTSTTAPTTSTTGMSTCTVTGDPHYITFDRALAHFQGTCSYIITESVSPGINEKHFQVVATNNHRGNNRVSFVSAVDVYLSNQLENVHVRIGPNKRVKVNGSEVSLPTTVGTLAQVVRQGRYIVVDAIDLKVHFDGRRTLLVRLGQNHQNRVTGMCGNFNRDPSDDKVLPNGTLAQNDNHFGHSWKSSTSQSGCGSTDERSDDGLDDCPFMEEYSELCRVITNSSGPFNACHLHSDPQPFFSSCVYDLCLSTPANGMLCSAVSAYESTCSVLGLNISEWRSALLCAESDPCEQLDCTENEWCGEKHGVYGCFCDEHHHRPNNESYDSSISCSSSSGTMSVSRCQLFEAGFHSSALHLRDDSCNGTLQDGRLVFHFDNDDQLCGTALRSNGTHFVYENTIQGDVDPHGALISRQRNIHLRFCCEYLLTQALSMDVGINPVESIVRKKLPSGHGQFHVRMIPYQDAGFRYPLASGGNIEMEIDERLYVEIRTEGVDGRQISTVMDSCWATPVNVASSPVRWDLIHEECPNPADGTVELVANGISTVARFSFKMFTFNNFTSIYLHCQVHLCLLRHNNCTAHCYPGHHNRVARDVSQHAMTGISLGPLTMPLNRKARMVNPSSASGQ